MTASAKLARAERIRATRMQVAIDLETTLIPERVGKKSSNLMAGKKQRVEVKSLIGDDQEKKLAFQPLLTSRVGASFKTSQAMAILLRLKLLARSSQPTPSLSTTETLAQQRLIWQRNVTEKRLLSLLPLIPHPQNLKTGLSLYLPKPLMVSLVT